MARMHSALRPFADSDRLFSAGGKLDSTRRLSKSASTPLQTFNADPCSGAGNFVELRREYHAEAVLPSARVRGRLSAEVGVRREPLLCFRAPV